MARPSGSGPFASADPFVRHLSGRWVPSLPTYVRGAALGLHTQFWDEPDLILTGPDDDAAALLGTVARAEPDRDGVSVPRGVAPFAAALGFAAGVTWAFRWTDVPTGYHVPDAAWLPASADDEVRDLLAAGFADASRPVGHPEVRRWAGLRRDGRLVACAADTTVTAGVGFVASVATHPNARGTGAGTALSAWITDALVREEGVAALWHMGDNGVADRLYTRLGYRDEHPMVEVTRPEG